jgi:hypothetical protein
MAKANPGIGRLLTAMRKIVVEVNDQEICRRLEILQNSEKEDLPPSVVKRLLEAPAEFDAREIPEPYTQYVKHYLYMVKRDSREKARQSDLQGEPDPAQKTGRQKKATPATGTGRPAARGKARKKTADRSGRRT